MQSELKDMLSHLTTVIEAERVDNRQFRDDVIERLADHGQRLTVIEAEQKQIKALVGGTIIKEVARLDGRIDQLAQDTALGRKKA